MSIGSDLLSAWPGLLAVGAGVGLLLVGGRDKPAASEHDLSDYHAPIGGSRLFVPDVDDVAPTAEPEASAEHLPLSVPDQARPRMDGVLWRPPYPELTVAQVTRRYGDDAEDIALRWLREIGQSEQSKAGIVRVVSPATDRDYTGAFPVCAVA